jgi:hypothetical protein
MPPALVARAMMICDCQLDTRKLRRDESLRFIVPAAQAHWDRSDATLNSAIICPLAFHFLAEKQNCRGGI